MYPKKQASTRLLSVQRAPCIGIYGPGKEQQLGEEVESWGRLSIIPRKSVQTQLVVVRVCTCACVLEKGRLQVSLSTDSTAINIDYGGRNRIIAK